MPTKPAPTLADLANQRFELERQEAEIQIPVLEALLATLDLDSTKTLLTSLKEAQTGLTAQNAAMVSNAVVTLDNLRPFVAQRLAMLRGASASVASGFSASLASVSESSAASAAISASSASASQLANIPLMPTTQS